jgi:hypothetical protein
MIAKRLRWGLKWLLGMSRGGRSFTVFPDDTFIVSYPKSGNTWARFLVANLLNQGEAVTFDNIENRIPDVYLNTRRFLESVPRPRIMKSHEYFDPRYKKVIYIARDPRDVAVSYYYHHLKKRSIEDGYPMERYIARFIAGDLDAFGSWKENVTSWLAARQGTCGFLLLRYEDMLEQPEQQLSQIADFLGLQSSPEQLARTIELSSARRMRKLEETQGNTWVITKSSRNDIPFVRLATSGGWKSILAADWVTRIESTWGPIIETLGYQLTTTASAGANRVSAMQNTFYETPRLGSFAERPRADFELS